MKCIIAGSRKIKDYSIVTQAINTSGFAAEIKEVVCGDAWGVDKLGEKWAIENKVPVKHFPAKWCDLTNSDAIIAENKYGKYDKKAGIRRNEAMGNHADALIAIIEDDSVGTSHMIEFMKKLDKRVYVWEV